MIKATLFFTKKNDTDDIITIRSSEVVPDLYSVRFETPDMKTAKKFMISGDRVLDYVEDILYSLSRDTDPFEHIQLSTSIHPSVMYHVSDLDDRVIRKLIVTMIRDAMRFQIYLQNV